VFAGNCTQDDAPASTFGKRLSIALGRLLASAAKSLQYRQLLPLMTAHVLFLAPEQPAPHRDYVRALKQVGARVTGIGHRPVHELDAELRSWLDRYESVRSLFDEGEVLRVARSLQASAAMSQIEAVDELLVLPAAKLREGLELPGLSVATALLCRDKTAMKEALRAAGVPCAASAAVTTVDEALAFAAREGYPLIAKPRDGLGSQKTYRVESDAQLTTATQEITANGQRSMAIEEFVEGHEGFYDTITVDGVPRHEFISHYYPNVLVAIQDRRIAPQIVATNRVDAPGYQELFALGRKVTLLLGLGTTATHMEWFFGPKGLKFSEIGARPPGERLWDLHCAGNEIALYREWALAVTTGRTEQVASRRFATGSVQVRPDQDGRIARYEGLDEVRRVCGEHIFASALPRPGAPTKPLRLGYLENVWFRLRHTDYDHLRALLDFIARTLKVRATA
jgi:formate-dependent phosphoribosylglycinamide formyltransferase (GAR transformylase)